MAEHKTESLVNGTADGANADAAVEDNGTEPDSSKIGEPDMAAGGTASEEKSDLDPNATESLTEKGTPDLQVVAGTAGSEEDASKVEGTKKVSKLDEIAELNEITVNEDQEDKNEDGPKNINKTECDKSEDHEISKDALITTENSKLSDGGLDKGELVDNDESSDIKKEDSKDVKRIKHDEKGYSDIVVEREDIVEKELGSEKHAEKSSIQKEDTAAETKDTNMDDDMDLGAIIFEEEDKINEILETVNDDEMEDRNKAESKAQGETDEAKEAREPGNCEVCPDDLKVTGIQGDQDGESSIDKAKQNADANAEVNDSDHNSVVIDNVTDKNRSSKNSEVDKANDPFVTAEKQLAGRESPNSKNNEFEKEIDNYQPEVGIVGPPTAVSELINEEELRNESVLPVERGDNVQDHVAEWVQNSVKAEVDEDVELHEEDAKENSKKTKKRSEVASATPARNSQRVVSNIIKRCIKCLNKMHAMDSGTGNVKIDKREGASPIVPQNQQNGAALPEEAAVNQLQVKQEPVSESEIDPDIVSEIQKAKNAKDSRKRRSTEDVQTTNGNSKRACLHEQREEFLAALVGGEKITTEELTLRADQLRAELLALDQLARAKEKEWNEILSMRKLKEEAYLRIERRRQVVGFMEGNGPLGETALAPANLTLEWDNPKEKSYSTQETLLKDKSSRPQQISSKQSENGQKDLDAQSLENRQIGEGRQGPIVDVRSIIADYRLRHPETVPRRGRRMRNSVNVGLSTGGGLVETGHTGDSRPSSTDSCKSNPNATVVDTNPMSFKDVLVQFAKLSQQQGEPVKTPQNYPDVTLHPVAPSPAPQVTVPQQAGSLLHGILTKSQSPRPTTFSPTLARLLTAPERERNSPIATSTPVQQNTNAATQHLLTSAYQGANPVSISDLLSSSKARTEITITPVVSTAVQSHSNNLIHVDDVEEETTVIEERGGRGSSNARDDRDSPPRCQGCHERAAQFVCAGCGNQWYCSRECQVSAWDEHSEVCSG